jgi:hypothetical protein
MYSIQRLSDATLCHAEWKYNEAEEAQRRKWLSLSGDIIKTRGQVYRMFDTLEAYQASIQCDIRMHDRGGNNVPPKHIVNTHSLPNPWTFMLTKERKERNPSFNKHCGV